MYAELKILCLLTALWLSCAAPGLPAETPDSKRVVSATGRFAAFCPPGQDVTYLVVWAEDVAARLENLLNISLPATRGEALYLLIEPGDGEISAEQYYDEFGLRQKLRVRGIGQADQEHVLENLCRLLLNRKTGERQIPFWFAAGAAQNLFPEARIRNTETAVAEWTTGQVPDFAEAIAFTGTEIPDARTRAFAGQAVAALLEWIPDSARREEFFALCAAGSEPDAAAIARLARLGAERDLEAAWDVWLASRQRIRTVGAGSPQLDAERLRAMLVISPEFVHLAAGREVQGEFSFRRLIKERDEEWVPSVAEFLNLKLESYAMGIAPETRQVIQAWRDFLLAVSAREAATRPWYSRSKTTRKSEKELFSMLRRAELLLESLELSAEAKIQK